MIFKFSDLKIIKSGKGTRRMAEVASFGNPVRFPGAASQGRLAVRGRRHRLSGVVVSFPGACALTIKANPTSSKLIQVGRVRNAEFGVRNLGMAGLKGLDSSWKLGWVDGA